LEYGWRNAAGAWKASVNGTKTLTLENQITVGATTEDRTISPWKVRAGFQWAQGPWQADAAVNYLDSYGNFYVDPSNVTRLQSVDAFTTVDLHARYGVEAAAGFLSGVTFSVNVSNLLNEDPPFALRAGSFSDRANPLGRVVWVGVKKDVGW
jgi:iron complex outermembrane receptor protein